MLLELDCFFFFFGFKSSLVCPFVKAADGGGKGDGNSSSFQEHSAGRAGAASAVSPGAFMASRRLALAAPGDQAWTNCTAVVILCPLVSCSILQRK